MARKASPKKPASSPTPLPAKHQTMKIDGHDEALIGMVTAFGGGNPVLVYDAEAIIQTLQDRDGMSEEDAVGHLEYNIAGAYVGTGTPLLLGRKPEGMDVDEWVDLLVDEST